MVDADGLGQRALDDPVLERLVGQDDDATADGKDAERVGDRPLEHGELAVHLDAQRLEDPLGGVARPLGGVGRRGDQDLDELARPLDRAPSRAP